MLRASFAFLMIARDVQASRIVVRAALIPTGALENRLRLEAKGNGRLACTSTAFADSSQ